MKINPIPYIAKKKPIRKYMYWAFRKPQNKNAIDTNVSNNNNLTNYAKIQKTFPKFLMVWLAGIQCYFMNKSKEMPKERKIPLMLNNMYSCTIALTTGFLFRKKISQMTSKMAHRAEELYKDSTHKKSVVNGIKTGVPFLTEAVLFQYVGPVIATPLAISSTAYLSKKGLIDLSGAKKTKQPSK